ncbi:MAG: ATP phosphoribosyltransferase [Ignavibacteria bacterium]
MVNGNLKLAIQKKGRLSDKSLELLKNCGIDIDDVYSERLIVTARNFNLDLLFLRDDDIPEYVQDGVADVGIVGEDVILEKQADITLVEKLGFGRCRLMIAGPEEKLPKTIQDISGKTIATSYPNILKGYLKENSLEAKIIEISGSVEITPSLGVADLICDIVSTGTTLMMNKLYKSFNVFDSESVLIANNALSVNAEKSIILNDLKSRISSVLSAKKSKYLMMNIPKQSLERITELLPSLKSPTVLHLADETSLAVHAVIPSDQVWTIMNDLKESGATGILLLPIENMIA